MSLTRHSVKVPRLRASDAVHMVRSSSSCVEMNCRVSTELSPVQAELAHRWGSHRRTMEQYILGRHLTAVLPQFTGARTLRVVAVCASRASRLARRCCGAEFPPKQACAGIVARDAGILAGTGNRASLWDVMRGRLLIYSSNILNQQYLHKNLGVPSEIRAPARLTPSPSQVARAVSLSGPRRRSVYSVDRGIDEGPFESITALDERIRREPHVLLGPYAYYYF